MTTVDAQVQKYASMLGIYETFSSKLDHLIRSLLDANEVKYQIVESRAKTVESFREKITRPGKLYDDPIAELPDLCGSRIIVYYADDVVKVSDMIKSEFFIIEEELAHQTESLDVDRFGYLSAHYVVRLSDGREGLAEWKFSKELHAEIQVRTVIQHAWSAVSHALQYKQETSVPSRLRRRLYRIAGLFELADEEFIGIRNQREQLEKSTAAAIASGNKNIPLSATSIIQMLGNWEYSKQAGMEARKAGLGISKFTDEDGTIREIYEIASRAGITNIEDLEGSIMPLDYSIYKHIANATKEVWTVSIDFLFFFLLWKRYPDLITYEELRDYDWGDSRARQVTDAILGAK